MPQPTQMWIYLYRFTFTPTESAAPVLPHRPQAQAGGAAAEVPPHDQGDDNAQIDHDVVVEQPPAQHRDLGQAGNGQVRKAIFDVLIVVHHRPADRLDAVAHKEVHPQAEGGQGQTGNVLVGLEGHGEGGEQQAAQGPHQEGGQDPDPQAVGIAADDIAEDGSHGHDALHAQVQAAGLLHHDLPYRAIEQGDVIDHDVVDKGGDHPKFIHFH